MITWVGAHDGVSAEVRLYDRLFSEAHPDAGGRDFLSSLNPNSLQVVNAIVEPSLAMCAADDKFQFERHGYFVADRKDHQPGKPVFNKSTGLKDGGHSRVQNTWETKKKCEANSLTLTTAVIDRSS